MPGDMRGRENDSLRTGIDVPAMEHEAKRKVSARDDRAGVVPAVDEDLDDLVTCPVRARTDCLLDHGERCRPTARAMLSGMGARGMRPVERSRLSAG